MAQQVDETARDDRRVGTGVLPVVKILASKLSSTLRSFRAEHCLVRRRLVEMVQEELHGQGDDREDDFQARFDQLEPL